jgi:diaminopimelate epimerase
MTVYILPFEKMHGLGNDFIMVEKRHLPHSLDEKKLAKELCHRNFGIGADGLIIVDLSSTRDAEFIWTYINSDGSDAEMCGNGMRCFAKYVFERGFTDDRTFRVQTKAGIITPTIEDDGSVTVDMGVPKLPLELKEKINVNGEEIEFTYIETGNPHCIIFLKEDVKDSYFELFGPKIEKHLRFPKGTNVEFVNVLNRNEINCRVWERGCGPTLACGTGACATLIAASLNGLADNNAVVNLPGGPLKVNWDKNSGHVFLNGPASFVFTGNYNLDPKNVCIAVQK